MPVWALVIGLVGLLGLLATIVVQACSLKRDAGAARGWGVDSGKILGAGFDPMLGGR